MTAILAFFLGPVGRVLAGGALLLAVAGGIWKSGANYERRKCDAAAVRAELAAVRQDLDAEKKARAADQQAIGELAKQKETDDEARRGLEAEIAKRPVAAQCRLSPADARRLR